MTPLPAIDSEELLYNGEQARVSRLTLSDGSRVILKEFLGDSAGRRVRHERRILERLAGVPGVPPLAPLAFSPNSFAMAEHRGARLADLVREQGMEMPEVARVGAQLARTVAAVHREGVAHKNLTPDSILSDEDGEITLVDFSLATTFAEDRPAFVHHREIAGDLRYLAPEQTGRTGRALDQRADLYGLGATLYHLATGRPPFEDKDPLLLIHDVLALVPVPPTWRNPAVPRPLNDIIMRLLEKEPDRRYQSAAGVAHDLARLSRALEAGETAPFCLGEADHALLLSSPSRLVGREREIAALAQAFEEAVAGRSSSLLVAGAPGVGKSALLNELRPMVTARGGFFAAGKFDQHRRDLESDAVHQALRALGRLLLAEPDADLARMRERIVTTQGPNAHLTAALVPEFSLLMGELAEAPPADPHNQERLVQATLDLLEAIGTPERPLVLVLDDLQWAPPPPLALVQAVAKRAIPGVLLVGAFREQDLREGHPLAELLPRLEQGESDALLLRLRNLDPPELAEFLQEMLRLERDQALQLTEAVALRSRGNPYDTVELVNSLRREGALVPAQGGWSWDSGAIRRFIGQGDVVELLEGRIARLAPGAQQLLEAMSCLGGEVELELLALAAALTPEGLDEELMEPLQEGLLVAWDRGRGVRFRHDRVQQAAFARLGSEARIRLHLTMARRLARHPEFQALAAEQYLPALDLLDPEESWLALQLLRRVAAASRTVNLEEGQRFLAAALELLERLDSRHNLALKVALKSELHAALYGLGRLDEADRQYLEIESLPCQPLQRADAACIQICSLTNRGRPQEAVELGLRLLDELGVTVPAAGELEARTVSGLNRFMRWIDGTGWIEDARRAELRHPAALAAARVMNRIIPPAYFSGRPQISWWLVIESQRLWMEHGPCAALIGPLSHVGFVAVIVAGNYRNGEQALRHVLAVSEARGWEVETSQGRFLQAMTVGPWFHQLQDNVQQALRAEEELLQGGDPQNACFTYYARVTQLLDCAPTLEAYAAEIERGLALAQRTGNAHVAAALLPYRRLVGTLRGEEGECWQSPEPFSSAVATRRSLGLPHVAAALCGALCGDLEELARHAAAAQEYLPYMLAMQQSVQCTLLLALALAQQAKLTPAPERSELLTRLEETREFFAGRAADYPVNFLHLLNWINAERAWSLGEFRDALGSFDQALQQVRELRRPWQHALITERAALFHLENGLGHLGRLLMDQARTVYREWGAAAKVRQLEAKYPFLRSARQEEKEAERTRLVSADALDMLAILRASQALSSETSLERLRSVVVELLRTMTGATAVSLVVREQQGREWFLLPPPGAEGGGEALPLGEAVAQGGLPVSVFNVAQRTMMPVMVEDATRDDRFSHDRYLADCACCSILALPILNHGTLRAVLLLENRLSRGAFTPDVLDAVTLIAGQLAVSLENALLYQGLEERVRERTRELQEAQSELVAAARHAGMAEIANNVLHNVGNVLNSVNVSSGVVAQRLKGTRLSGLSRSVELLREHAADLAGFFSRDERGKMLPGYLEKLERALVAEQREIVEELMRLSNSVDHIKEIVATQQCYAGSASLREPVLVSDLVEDALRMNQRALAQYEVTVRREFLPVPKLPLDKARLLQILVNLITNARQAMEEVEPGGRAMTLRVELTPEPSLRVTVSDCGVGIPLQHLSLIFSHGFTTKKGGHGFGLHSCALAAREMGGTLSAASPGPGEGATFVLEIPVQQDEDGAPDSAPSETPQRPLKYLRERPIS